VADAEGVVGAFAAPRKRRQAVLLAQGVHQAAAPGEDLVRVGLVAHVPHQAVHRGVEHVVQGDGQFDHPKAGAEVAARAAHGVQQFLAQLIGQGL